MRYHPGGSVPGIWMQIPFSFFTQNGLILKNVGFTLSQETTTEAVILK